MKKSIEEQIAESVAKGIEKAQEQEINQKKSSTIKAIASIALSFIFVIFLAQIFGESKSLYFIGGSISSFTFQYLLNRKELKKYPIATAIVSCLFGFVFMQMA